jgi:hypothetical protein
MARKEIEPDVVLHVELTPVAAQQLRHWLESAIPRQTTPHHIRHVLFKLHSALGGNA